MTYSPDAIGRDGEPLVGIDGKPQRDLERTPTNGQRPRSTKPVNHTPNPKAPLYVHESRQPPHPLDRAGAVETIANDVIFVIVGRMDGGPWSQSMASDGRVIFTSEERAKGIAAWLQRTSDANGTGLEYRVIPVMQSAKVL